MVPHIFCTAAEAADKLGTARALSYAGLGFAVVFAVLLVLMAFIYLISLAVGGVSKKPKTVLQETAVPTVPAAEKPSAASASADADAMSVTLNGKRHSVRVEEKLPRFVVTLNGKKHTADVEEITQEAEK